MGLTELQSYLNEHCRFKLSSGREVFGVVWKIGTSETERLVFSSVQEYKRAKDGNTESVDFIDLGPDEIVWAQRLVG